MTDKIQTTGMRTEPDAHWGDIWIAMQELGAAIAPLFELASPPSWAVTLRFAMDVALPDVEELAEAEPDDE